MGEGGSLGWLANSNRTCCRVRPVAIIGEGSDVSLRNSCCCKSSCNRVNSTLASKIVFFSSWASDMLFVCGLPLSSTHPMIMPEGICLFLLGYSLHLPMKVVSSVFQLGFIFATVYILPKLTLLCQAPL